jgi:hypothetical protein
VTRDEFTDLAYALIAGRGDVAFRWRPGPRALRRRPNMTVICVDTASPDPEGDMRAGLAAA